MLAEERRSSSDALMSYLSYPGYTAASAAQQQYNARSQVEDEECECCVQMLLFTPLLIMWMTLKLVKKILEYVALLLTCGWYGFGECCGKDYQIELMAITLAGIGVWLLTRAKGLGGGGWWVLGVAILLAGLFFPGLRMFQTSKVWMRHLRSSAAAARLENPNVMRPNIFYHGTSVENALRIHEEGFVPSEGSLGHGVYCTTTWPRAVDYIREPYGGVVLVLYIRNLGKCKQLVHDDPMMTTWQDAGYDSAWTPCSAVNTDDPGKQENCVKDPKRIKVIDVIAGDGDRLRRGGYNIIDGKLTRYSRYLGSVLSLPLLPGSRV